MLSRLVLAVARVLACVIGIAGAAPAVSAQDGSWTVKLTGNQAKGLAVAQADRPNWAFAISPDGAWGWAAGRGSVAVAEADALQFCRERLRAGRRDCLVYAANGKVVAPATVATRTIRAVYAPVYGQKAAAFFGVSPVSFKADVPAAAALLARIEENPGLIASLTPDRALMGQLTGRSLTTVRSRGFSFYLGQGTARVTSQGRGGLLVVNLPGWVATREGVLCAPSGRWSSGKPTGHRCMLLHAMSGGRVDMAWGFTPTKIQKGLVIAGDGGLAAVR